MSSNINVIMSGLTVQVVNTVDSTTRVNSSAGNPTLAGSEATYINFLPISNAGTVLSLPASPIYVFYIRNLGGINSAPSGNITVQYQVTGGTLNSTGNSPILVPLSVFSYWMAAESAGGIIAVTLTASVNATPVEILMAA